MRSRQFVSAAVIIASLIGCMDPITSPPDQLAKLDPSEAHKSSIDEDHPRFTNIDDDDNLNFAMGASLSKMGQASGWTTGNINATCATEAQYENGLSTGKTLLCQYDVHARSVLGDSGSPVFSYFISSVDPTVRWAFPHGILWGADGAGNFGFSPISAMRAELGGFVMGF